MTCQSVRRWLPGSLDGGLGGREQAHHVHRGPAAPGGKFSAFRAFPLFRRKLFFELPDYMAQLVNLLLPRDMAIVARRVTDILLTRHHLPDRLGLGTDRLPDINAEDHCVPPRVVVKHRLEWGIRIKATVPKRFAVDPNRREAGRQRARSGDMFVVDFVRRGVEIGEVAAADIDCADAEAHLAGIDAIEIDQPLECHP